MSNEKLARRWAESRNPNSLSEDARAARAYILDHTTPQSMDEVAWSDEEHALAGAVMDIGSGPVEVVMLSVDSDGYLTYASLDGKVAHEMRYEFTPNGKRFRLVEDMEPAHPETLTTVEDYEDAPIGTVVAAKTGVWLKNGWGDWETTRYPPSRLNRHMAGTERQVLRWGDGS